MQLGVALPLANSRDKSCAEPMKLLLFLWVAMAPPGAKNSGKAPRDSATPVAAATAPKPGTSKSGKSI